MKRRKNLARPTDGVTESGSGVPGGAGGAGGHPTGATDSIGAETGSTIGTVGSALGADDLEDLTILTADDPALGLTNTDDVPAEDWAADTGPTQTGEASEHGVDRDLEDADFEISPTKSRP